MDNYRCSKCSSGMDEGFTLDHSYGANLQAAWIEGQLGHRQRREIVRR